MSMHASRTAPEPTERTTVSLPAPLARQIRTLALSKRRSVSSILREALEAYLEGQEPPPLPSFTGVAASGEGDLSERVEEIVAEHVRRERDGDR